MMNKQERITVIKELAKYDTRVYNGGKAVLLLHGGNPKLGYQVYFREDPDNYKDDMWMVFWLTGTPRFHHNMKGIPLDTIDKWLAQWLVGIAVLLNDGCKTFYNTITKDNNLYVTSNDINA